MSMPLAKVKRGFELAVSSAASVCHLEQCRTGARAVAHHQCSAGEYTERYPPDLARTCPWQIHAKVLQSDAKWQGCSVTTCNLAG